MQMEPFRRAAGAVLRPCAAALVIALVIELVAVLQGRAAALAGVRSARRNCLARERGTYAARALQLSCGACERTPAPSLGL
ncbi:hypothetical protein KW5_0107870 [Xanthomonas vasicola pv. vasculorum NCPPB 1326]|nr:hypothetical protein KW5_0107870 [Xanthomonas vasicola pv. vasculorum NCPPB 1326]